MKNNILILGGATLDAYVKAIIQHCDPEDIAVFYTDTESVDLQIACSNLGIESEYMTSAADINRETIKTVLLFSRGDDFDKDLIPHFISQNATIVIIPVK